MICARAAYIQDLHAAGATSERRQKSIECTNKLRLVLLTALGWARCGLGVVAHHSYAGDALRQLGRKLTADSDRRISGGFASGSNGVRLGHGTACQCSRDVTPTAES